MRKKAGEGRCLRRLPHPPMGIYRSSAVPNDGELPVSPLPVSAIQRRGKAHQGKKLRPIPKRVGASRGSGNLDDLVVAELRGLVGIAKLLAEGGDRDREALVDARLVEAGDRVGLGDRRCDQLADVAVRRLVADLEEAIFVGVGTPPLSSSSPRRSAERRSSSPGRPRRDLVDRRHRWPAPISPASTLSLLKSSRLSARVS